MGLKMAGFDISKFLTGMDQPEIESRGVDLVNRIGKAGQSPMASALGAMPSVDPQIAFPERMDLGKHAVGAEAITNRFGPGAARVAGLGKEVTDLFSGRGFDVSDLTANEIGINNAEDQRGTMSRMLSLFGKQPEPNAGAEVAGGSAGGGIWKDILGRMSIFGQ